MIKGLGEIRRRTSLVRGALIESVDDFMIVDSLPGNPYGNIPVAFINRDKNQQGKIKKPPPQQGAKV
jgi:hypothetical protein